MHNLMLMSKSTCTLFLKTGCPTLSEIGRNLEDFRKINQRMSKMEES